MICAAAVTAQFVGGKATRDALYLANLDVTSLPMMVVATSIVSIALVAVASKLLGAASPATFVPLAFASSAVLLLGRVGLVVRRSARRRVVVYLQISGIGPMLGSGFWLIVTECFDPRTAKRRFGQIAGAGTLGGLLGGLFAERMARHLRRRRPCCRRSPCMNLFCAWQIRRLARALPVARAIAVSATRLRSRRRRSVGAARASRRAVPAEPRRARPARHDRRGARRLRLQGAGGRRRLGAATPCCAFSPCTTRRSA